MEDMDKVLSKVAKLFNLAEGASTEAEAETALLSARRLMAKYNLSEEQCKHTKEDVIALHKDFLKSKLVWWHKELLSIITKNNRCKGLFSGRTLVIIGLEKDVKFVDRFFDILSNKILELFKVYLKSVPKDYSLSLGERQSISKRLKVFYIEGFLYGFNEKLEDQFKGETGLALITETPAVVKEFIEDNFSVKNSTYGSKAILTDMKDAGAFIRGKIDGVSVKMEEE